MIPFNNVNLHLSTNWDIAILRAVNIKLAIQSRILFLKTELVDFTRKYRVERKNCQHLSDWMSNLFRWEV